MITSNLPPAYEVISWSEFNDLFLPASLDSFEKAHSNEKLMPEIRVYRQLKRGKMVFHNDLLLNDEADYCVAVQGDAVIDGDLQVIKRKAPLFCYISGNLAAHNLIASGLNDVVVEGDAQIDNLILGSYEIEGKDYVLIDAGCIAIGGKTKAKVIIKNDFVVLFEDKTIAYAVGDYGNCDFSIFPEELQCVMPYHDFADKFFKGSTLSYLKENGRLNGAEILTVLNKNRSLLSGLNPSKEKKMAKDDFHLIRP